MTTPTIAEYLKYANLQMAAEAFIRDPETLVLASSGQELINKLVAGNGHASRFTASEAAKLSDPAKGWTILDQRANTNTGFSGTLFQNTITRELVVSFRSTEFIDDAARDNEATNKLEIGDFGFAFGQLADMEKWYAELKRAGGPLNGKAFSVTGYSLGGHLATAFNLLHPGAAAQVITFNGAGIGKIGDGSLESTYGGLPRMVARFQELLNQARDTGNLEAKFTTPEALTAYRAIKRLIAANRGVPTAAMDSAIPRNEWANLSSLAQQELTRLGNALATAAKVAGEAARVPLLSSGGVEASSPKDVPLAEIAAASLDYQLAVRLTSAEFSTEALSIPVSAANIWFGKTRGEGASSITNQYDLVGTETTTIPTGMVSNCQYHYGIDAHVFIEDQPLYRGNAPSEAAKTSRANSGVKLFVSGYNENDFGDTHSLVLIVDSLNVQNLLKTLAPESSQDQIETLFKAASAARARSDAGTQGKAEGDVLENILDGLSRLFLAVDPLTRNDNARNGDDLLTGNTWADPDHRARFYTALDAVARTIQDGELAGKLTLSLPEAALATAARTDFAAFLTLLTGSPVALRAKTGEEEAVNAALGAAWADVDGIDVYAGWLADQALTQAERAAGLGNTTDAFLQDRAAYLGWVSTANLSNLPETSGRTVIDTRPFDFQEVRNREFTQLDASPGLGHTYFVRGSIIGGTSRIIFGAGDADALTGGHEADHLYGGAGDDTLSGAQGNDWLEGQSGADTLLGGEGRDTLLGGAGDDLLEGGSEADLLRGGAGDDTLRGGGGSDTLAGGLGDDTYTLIAGDGMDWIEDADGEGRIRLGDVVIGDAAGAIAYVGPRVWRQTIGNVLINYVLSTAVDSNGATRDFLTLQSSAGIGAYLTQWTQGALGITLPGAPVLVDPLPDTVPLETVHRTLTGIPDVVYTGYILAEGNQAISAGMDPLFTDPWRNPLGVSGNNLITGSTGNDVLGSGHGNSVLIGHGGQDLLFVLDGNSRLYAGEEADLAIALEQARSASATGAPGSVFLTGNGNSTVVGSTGNDLMLLGNGNHVAVLGPGNNLLVTGVDAFVPNNVTTLGWSVTAASDNPLDIDIDWGRVMLDGRGPLLPEAYDGNVAYQQTVGSIEEVRIHAPGSGNNVIYAGTGQDTILLGNGSNLVIGGAGRTTVFGGTGADTVYGGTGNLAAAGRGGDDSLIGGTGNDLLLGGGGNDALFGGYGNDRLEGDGALTPAGLSGDDVLDGGAGDDVLFGNEGQDTLAGGSGEDRLYGGEGNDTLTGGSGMDVLRGEAGDDTYVFALGDSRPNALGETDTVDDALGTNRIVLEGVGSGSTGNGDLVITREGEALLLSRGQDRIFVLGGFTGAVASYGFADGSSLGYPEMIARYGQFNASQTTTQAGADLVGGARNDTLVASGGGSTLRGGRGDDVLAGDGGNNTYAFAWGDGRDRLVDTSPRTDAAGSALPNTLRFDAGVSAADLRLRLEGNALVVALGDDGAGGEVWIEGVSPENPWAAPIERFVFADGSVLGLAELLGDGFSGTEADEVLWGTPAAERLDGGGGDDTILAGDGDDTLSGGAGDDVLAGGAGADCFVIDGLGDDTVQDFMAGDRLVFGEGIWPEGLTARATTGSDGRPALRLGLGEGSVVLEGGFAAPAGTFAFADGQNLSLVELLQRGTAQRTTLIGSGGNFVFSATAGDTLTGSGGDDTLSAWGDGAQLLGGSGESLLEAHGDGSTLVGGSGHDTLSAWGDDCVLVSGPGVVEMVSAGQNTRYVLYPGTSATLHDAGRGAATLWLPETLALTDFSVSRAGDDLLLAARSGGTLVTLQGYFSAPAEERGWVVLGGDGSARLLDDWVGSELAAGDYAADVAAAEDAFAAGLAADLQTRGRRGAALGGLAGLDAGEGVEVPSLGYSVPVGSYRFGGLTQDSAALAAGETRLSPSLEDEVAVTTVRQTVSYTIPGYSVSTTLPGASRIVSLPLGSLPPVASGATVSLLGHVGVAGGQTLYFQAGDHPELDPRFQGGAGVSSRYLVRYPGTQETLSVASSSGTRTAEVQQALVERNVTLHRLTGDDADHTVLAESPFFGTLRLGAGDDVVNLGSSAAEAGDWLSGGGGMPSFAALRAQGMGAFVSAGGGNDTIVGTDGNDGLAAGSGHDVLDGGRGADTYYAPLAADSLTVIRDSGDPQPHVDFMMYGGFPLDTLVLPDGVRPEDLSVAVFDDPENPGLQLLQIRYQEGNILVAFAPPPSPGWTGLATEAGLGVERFQFADGTVLSREALIARAAALSNASAPTVALAGWDVQAGETLAVAGLLTAVDADGNGLARIQARLEGSGDGALLLDGVAQEAGALLDLAIADVNDLAYRGGGAGSENQLFIRAFDGGRWSDWTSSRLAVRTGATVLAPEQDTATNFVPVLLAGYISAQSPVGAAIQRFEILDRRDGAGRVLLDGLLPDEASFVVAAENLERVRFLAMAAGEPDTVMIRADDGAGWGAWTSLALAGEDEGVVLRAGTAGERVEGGSAEGILVARADNTLASGSGRQTFFLGLGSGTTQLYSSARADPDVIRFGAGVTLESIRARVSGNDLVLEFGSQGDRAIVHNFQGGVAGGACLIGSFETCDAGYATFSRSALGETHWRSFDAEGNPLADAWTRSNGTVGQDRYFEDGSRERTLSYSAGAVRYESVEMRSADGSTHSVRQGSDGSQQVEDFDARTGAVHSTGVVVRSDSRMSYDKSGSGTGDWASLITTTYANGSSSAFSNAHSADGTNRSGWQLADGSAGYDVRDSSGRQIATGTVSADGRATLRTGGNSLLTGSAAADTLNGGAGNDFLAGGRGDDRVSLGAGRDLVAFNAGDGHDRIVLGSDGGDSVSLGGVSFDSDLWFSRSGNDLVLGVSEEDSLTFEDWYAAGSRRGITSLQIIAPAVMAASWPESSPVTRFDFQDLVDHFDAAQHESPGLQAWNFPRSLLEASAEGSAENALGGGLAFHFGRHGNFAGVSMASAQSVASWSEFLSTGQGIGGLVPFASEAAYLR